MPIKTQYTWGRDGESFTGIHDTVDEAIQEAVDSGAFGLGDQVEVAVAIRPTGSDLAGGVCVDMLLEGLTDFACDNYGEHAEDWPDLSTEDKAILEAELHAVLAKRLPEANFWSVHDPKFYTVERKHLPPTTGEETD